MKLEIFNVEHGQCALLTGDEGEHMLIDCGHNSTTGWRPSSHLKNLGVQTLDRLIVTNYDEDHVSDLPNILDELKIRILMRNKSVNSGDLYALKSECGCGAGIESLAEMINRFTHPITDLPSFGGLEITSFCNRYPNDFDDENNLSLVVILSWPNFKICFPGDMEKAGWLKLLERHDFREAVSDLNVLVASHHGRESGCCEELFTQTNLEPNVIVISDENIQYKTQEDTTEWYAAKAIGYEYNGQIRKVFSTRKDGKISFEIRANGATLSTGG